MDFLFVANIVRTEHWTSQYKEVVCLVSNTVESRSYVLAHLSWGWGSVEGEQLQSRKKPGSKWLRMVTPSKYPCVRLLGENRPAVSMEEEEGILNGGDSEESSGENHKW